MQSYFNLKAIFIKVKATHCYVVFNKTLTNHGNAHETTSLLRTDFVTLIILIKILTVNNQQLMIHSS